RRDLNELATELHDLGLGGAGGGWCGGLFGGAGGWCGGLGAAARECRHTQFLPSRCARSFSELSVAGARQSMSRTTREATTRVSATHPESRSLSRAHTESPGYDAVRGSFAAEIRRMKPLTYVCANSNVLCAA